MVPSRKFRRNAFILLILFAVLICSTFNWYSSESSTLRNQVHDELRFTAAYPNDWEEVERTLYRPHGFAIQKSAQPLPTLRRIVPKPCSVIFEEWLSANSNETSNTSVPPEEPPKEMRQMFEMYGHGAIEKRYFNNMLSNPIVWAKEALDKEINSTKLITTYEPDGVSVYFAVKKYSVQNQVGLIVGSVNPWVETACLRNGARHVTTVDYQTITTDHPKITFLHAMSLAKNWCKYAEKYDFVVSYSSIEHSGLGRFGDPLDPIGDLREMQKIRCLMKKNGLLFLGIPVGMDKVTFNAHRIYGRLRIPMMIEGFELVDVFDEKRSISVNELPFGKTSPKSESQFLFVLRKIN